MTRVALSAPAACLPMKPRILVIDDEAAISDSLKMILEYEGYEVLTAATGEEGIAQAEREAPDLVFLDVKMPGMDGLEVLQRLRHLVEVTPIVVVSGHGTVSTAVEATKLGAFDFIEKPLERERVLVTVRNAVDSRRLRTENRSFKRDAEKRYQIVGDSPLLAAVRESIAQGGADQRHGADLGRERRRQGAGGARHSSREPAAGWPVRAGQLRGDSRRADRVGAVRPREGFVHRRHRPTDWQVRAGRQRARSSSTKSAT